VARPRLRATASAGMLFCSPFRLRDRASEANVDCDDDRGDREAAARNRDLSWWSRTLSEYLRRRTVAEQDRHKFLAGACS